MRASEARLAVMEERQGLARDLHDSAAQALYAITMYAEAARQLVGDRLQLGHAVQFVQSDSTAMDTVLSLLIFTVPGVIIGGQLGSAVASHIPRRVLERSMDVLYLVGVWCTIPIHVLCPDTSRSTCCPAALPRA